MQLINSRTLYEGKVQGVGFRYTVYQIAKGFDVLGEVQNRPDGRVLLIAQGQPSEVHAFVETVEMQMKSYIKGKESNSIAIENYQYQDFSITYYCPA